MVNDLCRAVGRALAALLVMCLYLDPAGATVGGDDHIELLGYEPTDRKLYFLEHIGGEAGELPRLHFFALGGATPGKAVPVQSWYTGPLQAREQAFPDRLKALRARLRPLAPSTLAGARLIVDHRPLRICASARVKPADEAASAAAIARWKAGQGDIDSPACRPVAVQVSWKGHHGAFEAEVWTPPTLIDVRPLEDPRFALAIVRFGGKHYESGYAVEKVLLLTRDAAQ